jgi:hypothetical protein
VNGMLERQKNLKTGKHLIPVSVDVIKKEELSEVFLSYL